MFLRGIWEWVAEPVGEPVLHSFSMTTGDVVCDVTYMFVPVLVVGPEKTKEDEEVEVTASYIALAQSVTKTVSTWICSLFLSLPLDILSFLRQRSDRGLDSTDAPCCPFISRQRIIPVTLPPSPFACRHQYCTLEPWTTSPRFDTGRYGFGECYSSDDTRTSCFSSQLSSVSEASC
jgi:hypothetical protein